MKLLTATVIEPIWGVLRPLRQIDLNLELNTPQVLTSPSNTMSSPMKNGKFEMEMYFLTPWKTIIGNLTKLIGLLPIVDFISILRNYFNFSNIYTVKRWSVYDNRGIDCKHWFDFILWNANSIFFWSKYSKLLQKIFKIPFFSSHLRKEIFRADFWRNF